MSKSSFNIAVDNVISEIVQDVDSNEELDLFLSDISIVKDAYSIIKLSLKNVIKNRVDNREELVLPYIGRFKIKDRFKIVLKLREKVVRELGYNNWNELPKDILKIAQIKVNVLLNKELANKPKAVRKFNQDR